MCYSLEDMVETLDDYYLLFLNKFEDIILLMVKSLVLGLGCSFEIEKKISQQSINFEYNSRIFKHFMNVICKLFGMQVEIKLANGQKEYFRCDPSAAKIKLGTGAPIRLEISDNDTITVVYSTQYFMDKGLDIDAVNLNPVQETGSLVPRTFSMFRKEYGIQEDKPNSGNKERKASAGDDQHFMQEDYISNKNIYNPFSLYSSEIDFKRTSQGEGNLSKLGQESNYADFNLLENDYNKIDLADYYSGDKQPIRTDSFTQVDRGSAGIKPFFQPVMKINVTTANIIDTSEEPSDKVKNNMVTKELISNDKEAQDCQQEGFKMVNSDEMNNAGHKTRNQDSSSHSEEPSILYHYDLGQSIDFANGSEFLESVHCQLKDQPTGRQTLADHIKASLMPRESVDLTPMALPLKCNSDNIRDEYGKRNTLCDHIKLLMTSDIGQSTHEPIKEENKEESPSGQAALFENDIDKIVIIYGVKNPIIDMNGKYSSEEADPTPTSEREQGQRPIAATIPSKTAYINPLMCSLGLTQQNNSGSKQWPRSAESKPLVELTEQQIYKKRPTANVDLMKQISQAMHNKLMNDSFAGQRSPTRSVSKDIFDLTPIEVEGADDLPEARKLADTGISLEPESMTRKTKFLANSETQKACRICNKVFKMTKMYYFDHSFFCETCYGTASQKLKKKGLQQCAGCSQIPDKVLIVKFILSNKFTKNQGSLLFTKEMSVQPYYEYLHKYSAMIAKSQKLDRALVLISNNVTTPFTTMAELKLCKKCISDFSKCCVCKDTLYKQEMFKGDSCIHSYCIDCLSLIFLKKYVTKTQFTCKGKLCWKKSSLEQALNFITQSLETIQEEFSRSGVSVK